MEKNLSTAVTSEALGASAKPVSLARRGFLASAAAGVAAATSPRWHDVGFLAHT